MVRQKLIRIKRFLLVGLVSLSFVVGTTEPAYAANAADSDISSTLNGNVLDHQLYYYLASCFSQIDMDKVTSEEVKEWRWWWGSDTFAHRGDMYENDYVKCSEGQWLKEAFGRFGFTDPVDTFCRLGFTYNRDTGGLGGGDGGDSVEACKSGIDVGDFDGSGSRSGQLSDLEELLGSAANGAKAKGALSAQEEYIRKYRTFMNGCNVTIIEKYDEERDPANGDGKLYKVPIVKAGGEKVEYYLGRGDNHDKNVDLVANRREYFPTSQTTDCGQLAEDIRALAPQYLAYMKSEEGKNDGTLDDEDAGGDNAPVCSAGALGWVFCPLMEFMGNAITNIAEFLEGFLVFEPITIGPKGDALRAIWGIVVVIANVGLIITFLFVAFSQATSVGISSYGIKKLLPKIIAAAVLINLSFYICAAAVDISNILGVSVRPIVDAGINATQANKTPDAQVGASFGQNAVVLTGAVLAGGIAIGTGAIALLLPVLMSAVLAIFTAFAIIAAREVILTLLIVIAPLAFLAAVLPNTESWFTKWRKLFTTMLLMFPLVMIVFYGSVLVSSLIMATHTNQTGAQNIEDFMVNVFAFGVLMLPLFSLPFIMKSAGGIMDRLGILVNNRNKGLVDRSRKLGSDLNKNSRFNQALAYRRENRDVARTVRRGRPTAFNRAMGTVGGGGYGAYTARKATAIEDKEFEQGVADAATLQKNYSSDRLDAIAQGRIAASGQERVAAARWVMQNGNFTQRQALYETMTDDNTDDMKRLRQSVSSQYFAKGDNKIMGSSYGGQLLEGVGGTANDRAAALRQNLATNMNKEKIDAQAMVHDADATKLVLEIARDPNARDTSGNRISGEAIESLSRSAKEALSNETTRTKATAGVYEKPITDIGALAPTPPTGGGPTPPPTPPPAPPTPPTPPPPPPTPPSGGGGGTP